MTPQACYEAMGEDYSVIFSRFHSEALIARFAKMFLRDPSMQLLVDSLASGDVKEAFRASHTLKGVSMNLGLERISEANHPVVEALRAGNLDLAKQHFPKLKEAHDCAIEAIGKMD